MAALLAACGGGGGTDVDGGGGGGPGLAIPTWSQRIEPFEPKAAALKGVAQGSTSSRAMAQAGATRVIALAPLQRATPERAAAAGSAAVPRQIGTARAVAETVDVARTAALLPWRPTARGTQVAALRFESPGARGLRLGVLVQALPPGA
ncbi:MAG: endoproteinase ArgC, partial [Alicycliphilus sp.]|nr:endoproteinase ArgC [Alicycliphilus sp.]